MPLALSSFLGFVVFLLVVFDFTWTLLVKIESAIRNFIFLFQFDFFSSFRLEFYFSFVSGCCWSNWLHVWEVNPAWNLHSDSLVLLVSRPKFSRFWVI